MTIADIAHYPWVAIHERRGVSIDALENLQRWLGEIGKREAVVRGVERLEAPSA